MATQTNNLNTSRTGYGKVIRKPYYVFKRLFTKTSVDESPVVPRPRKERKFFFKKTVNPPITPVAPVPVTAPITTPVITAPIITPVKTIAELAAETDSIGIIEPFTPKGTETTLSRVLSTSPEYERVVSTFNMTHAKIMAIFSIEMPSKLQDDHEGYKEEIKTNNSTTPDLVTKKLFHGTKSTCNPKNLIDKGEACDNVACGLCGILKGGNKLSASRTNGLWFAQHANTSNGYTLPYSGSQLRVMYLVDVVNAANVAYTVSIPHEKATLPRHLVIYKL